MRTFLVTVLLFCGLVSTVHAEDIDLDALQGEAQATFDAVANDLAAVVSFVDPIAGSSSRLFRFDGGLSVSAVPLESPDAVRLVGLDATTVPVPRLYAGASILSLSGLLAYTPLFNGGSITGLQASYDVFSGIVFPTVGLHANYSALNGFNTVSARTQSFGVTASKKIAFFSVYGTLGAESTKVESKSTQVSFNAYEKSGARVALGANLSLGLVQFGLQILDTFEHTVTTASFGLNI